MKKVTIAGAGIGGITAALVLHRAGHRVTIVERAEKLEPLGAGIVLAANAGGILRTLGVDLDAHGHRLTRLAVLTAEGGHIQTLDFGRFLKGVGQVLSFRRGELHAALMAALPKEVTLRFGCPIEAWDGQQDVLIGADGIRSVVRERLLGSLPLRYSGVTCWRTVLPNPGVSEGFEAWGGTARIGVVPLRANRIYVFLVLTAPRGTERQTSIEEVRRHFAHFAAPVPAILDAARGVTLLHHDLEELEGPVWGKGSTVLIGDAAHAMTPNQGQGAAMAIEDAAALPDALATDSPAETLAALRHARVVKVQRDSRRLGEIAHWSSPLAAGFRNLLFRSLPDSVSEKHYLQLIAPGLALAARLEALQLS